MSRFRNVWYETMFVSVCFLAATTSLETARAAGKETVLYSFTGGNDGAREYNGVVKDKAGNLYGATASGGNNDAGVIFKLAPDGTETVLHSFTGGHDGNNPYTDLLLDQEGNLYGADPYGGGHDFGLVFEITPQGKETRLYSFRGGNDGGWPNGYLIRDKSGILYGTTYIGGNTNAGTVYSLAPGGHAKVLYSFDTIESGFHPSAQLVRDKDGNIFGTTAGGGDPYCDDTGQGCGAIFKVSPDGKETVLHAFDGKDGYGPDNLVMGVDGNLYGTLGGGVYHFGAIFRLTPKGELAWLYSFQYGNEDGQGPASLIGDNQGNLYGVTGSGGAYNHGTIFKVTLRGVESLLYSFAGGADGASPYGGLLIDKNGDLYGTTLTGGAYDAGTVFKLKH